MPNTETITEKGVVIKRTRNGLGICATKKFKKSAVLFHVKGRVYNYKTINKISGTFQDNTFRFGQETYLSPAGYIGDFLNHSCKPNSAVKKLLGKLYIWAITDIAKGEEVTIDYSTTLASDDIWTMRCNCGQGECRKLIKRFNTLPKSLQQEYIAKNIVPTYILRM